MHLKMSTFVSWLSMGLFLLSMASGLIVVFAYHPSLAYDSVQKMRFIIPYGDFFRALHYFSSEAFTLMLLLHIGFEVAKKKIKISNTSWNYSILGFFLVVVLMFTGFVLKGDQSASAATDVAFNLMKNTPILSHLVPLFQDESVYYYKFFIWHVIFLPLVLSLAIYKHVSTLTVKIEYFTIAIGLSIAGYLLFVMPPDIALTQKVDTLKGPWFFWGAENLLRVNFSSLAVNLILLIPFGLLMALPHIGYKKSIKTLIVAWVLGYFAMSLIW
ncbi:cytochrome b N-terminal domain-containing protein [Sulfurospirillum sp. 1612]|uniref:cytochrome b N-terminal domain-containing protein n=1 Tax=Sulfurospirillum sp. 1612 TaxID=3094835 RepID=UPI002F92E9AF